MIRSIPLATARVNPETGSGCWKQAPVLLFKLACGTQTKPEESGSAQKEARRFWPPASRHSCRVRGLRRVALRARTCRKSRSGRRGRGCGHKRGGCRIDVQTGFQGGRFGAITTASTATAGAAGYFTTIAIGFSASGPGRVGGANRIGQARHFSRLD